EGRPGPHDAWQVQGIKEEVVVPRAARVGLAGCEATGEVAHVAPDEVLVEEEVTPARPGERIPPETEDGERDDAGRREKRDQPSELALPEEKEDQRDSEQRGRPRPLGEHAETDERQRRRGTTAVALAPPAVRLAERQAKQQDEEAVGPGDTRVGEHGPGGREHHARREPGGRSEQPPAEPQRPPHPPP